MPKGNQPLQGSPSTTTPGQAGAVGESEPQYITKEQFEQAIRGLADTLNQSVSKSYQSLQGRQDTLESRVGKQLSTLDDWIKRAEASGVQLTKEQKAQLRQETLLDAFNPPPPDNTQQGAPEPEVPTEEEVDPVTLAGWAMMDAQGIGIEDEDPEIKIIQDGATGTPEEYFKAVQEAINTKKARLATSPEDAATHLPGLGGGGLPNSNPIANIIDPDQLWEVVQKSGRV